VFTLLVAHEPFIARAVCFMIGALAMTFGAGLLVIVLLHSAGAGDESASHALSGTVDIVLGALLIAASELVRRRPPSARGSRAIENRWVVRLMRSPGLAVVLGAAMYLPSPLYLAALNIVADADLPTARQAIWLGVMTLIVTSMIEIPVIWMLLNPARGRSVLADVNAWMTRNGRAVSRWMLLVAGLYLVVRGLARV